MTSLCGIFGYFGKDPVKLRIVVRVLQLLEKHRYLHESSSVGGHGAGIAFANISGKIIVRKVGKIGASPAVNLAKFKEIAFQQARIIIAHVRRASLGLEKTVEWKECTQPYEVNCFHIQEIVSAHNGKVRNYLAIRNALSENHRFESECVHLVDSEVIPHLFEEEFRRGNNEIEARNRTFTRLKGNNTAVLLTWFENKGNIHVLHKGRTRGLSVWTNHYGETVICSREEPIKEVLGDTLRKRNFNKVISVKWQERKEVQETFKIEDC